MRASRSAQLSAVVFYRLCPQEHRRLARGENKADSLRSESARPSVVTARVMSSAMTRQHPASRFRHSMRTLSQAMHRKLDDAAERKLLPPRARPTLASLCHLMARCEEKMPRRANSTHSEFPFDPSAA